MEIGPNPRLECYDVILDELSVFVERRPVENSAAFMLHLVEGSNPPHSHPAISCDKAHSNGFDGTD
jgi:hypothetical protein